MKYIIVDEAGDAFTIESYTPEMVQSANDGVLLIIDPATSCELYNGEWIQLSEFEPE